MYDPYDHADQLDIAVGISHSPYFDSHPEHDGYWSPRQNAIFLRPGMRQIQERCVLAHEVAHALNGHHDSSPKNETIADRCAAELLVDRDQLIDLMIARPDNYVAWSLELGITTKLMRMYLNVHRLDLARGRREPYRVEPMVLRAVG